MYAIAFMHWHLMRSILTSKQQVFLYYQEASAVQYNALIPFAKGNAVYYTAMYFVQRCHRLAAYLGLFV